MTTLLSKYPACLVAEFAKYGKEPSGNVDWDRAVLQTLRCGDDKKNEPWLKMDGLVGAARREQSKAQIEAVDLTDHNTYCAHANFLIYVANEIVLKPQSVDEAILQMNLLDHRFYMFLNSDNDKICVVYARNDGGYGLIIPDID